MTASNLPPLTWLRAFEATARHLSFTNAARELNLTQSAVSQHVRNLEFYLSRELFIRKTRALELTEDGANYLPIVSAAFELISSGTQTFRGTDRNKYIVLQCNNAFSVFWLAPRLNRLYQKYPWLVLNIITPIWDPERNATKVDIEIRFGRPESMPTGSTRLTQDQYFPVCAPNYQNGNIELSSATLFDCVGLTNTWNSWFNSQGQEFKRKNHVTVGSTFVITITAALFSAGISMAHDTLVLDLLKQNKLIRPFEHAPPLTEGYFLIPPAKNSETPATQIFIDWLFEEIQIFNQN